MVRQTPKSKSKIDLPGLPKKISEGKTKIIWQTNNPNFVRIESKNQITAGDGLRKDIIRGKAEIATTTTANVFKLLKKKRIPTHFVKQISANSFKAKSCSMIPFECVARRIATGSIVQRNPEIKKGQRFEDTPVEFYLKDDQRHDPIILFENSKGKLFDPHHPLKDQKPIGEINLKTFGLRQKDIKEMIRITKSVIEILETAWERQGVVIMDVKIEFGKDMKGKIIVADVIDNDSWRIKKNGKHLDKQVYREGGSLKMVRNNYTQVAELTRQFIPA